MNKLLPGHELESFFLPYQNQEEGDNLTDFMKKIRIKWNGNSKKLKCDEKAPKGNSLRKDRVEIAQHKKETIVIEILHRI